MSMIDENLVYLLFDIGYLVYLGEDLIVILNKYVSRIKYVYLKDIRVEVLEKVKKEKMSFLKGVRVGVFIVLGDGCINFELIFKVLEENNYEGWLLVEVE